MITLELVKISRRFIGRVKFTSQDLDYFSHTSQSSQHSDDSDITIGIKFIFGNSKLEYSFSDDSVVLL